MWKVVIFIFTIICATNACSQATCDYLTTQNNLLQSQVTQFGTVIAVETMQAVAAAKERDQCLATLGLLNETLTLLNQVVQMDEEIILCDIQEEQMANDHIQTMSDIYTYVSKPWNANKWVNAHLGQNITFPIVVETQEKGNITIKIAPNSNNVFINLGKQFDGTGFIEYFVGLVLDALAVFGVPVGPGGSPMSGSTWYTENIFFFPDNDATILRFVQQFIYHFVSGDVLNNNFTNGPIALNISQEGRVRFDCDGNIINSYFIVADLWQQAVWTGTSGVTSAQIAQAICAQIMQSCTGSNQYYNSTEDCTEYVSNLPVGNLDTFGTVKGSRCLAFHAKLAKRFPFPHCRHASKQSDTCLDFTSQSFFDPAGFYLGIDPTVGDMQECAVRSRECKTLKSARNALWLQFYQLWSQLDPMCRPDLPPAA